MTIPAAALYPMPAEIALPIAMADKVQVFEFSQVRTMSWGSLVNSQHMEAVSKDAAPLWSPVTLLPGTMARRSSSIATVTALVVDIDHGETWDDTLARMAGLSWWAYTTHSHTDEAHRFRIVFPLARPVPAEQWKRAWSATIDALGIQADKACSDPARIYYTPTHAPGAPWEMLDQSGELIDMLEILATVPTPAPTPTAPRRQKPAGNGDYKTLDLMAWANSNGAQPLREDGGEGKIYVTCPWKAEHTGGAQGPKDTYLLDKGDGWPIFRCAHSHCRDRGTHALLEAWPNADEHCAREYVPPARISPTSSRTEDEQPNEDEIDWPVSRVVKSTGEFVIPGCEANASAWMRHEHAGKVAFNELTGELELSGEPVTDSITSQLLIQVQVLTQSVFHARHVEGAIRALIEDPSTRRYHPVRDYLEALTWDHMPRLSSLIEAGVVQLQDGADEDLCSEYLLRFFVGAVARQMSPGCKHDCALIFQGPQGLGKSSFFRAILPHERWFCDSMGELDDKDSRLILSRAWIFEWSELESVRRSNMGAVKAFLSAQDDDVRAPYARSSVFRKRSCVIVGSTNEDQFIVDPTGGRRFWVVPVLAIDRDEVRRYRDQLWAEAVHIYRTQWADLPDDKRPSLPPWALSSAAELAQRNENESRIAHDPWESAICSWLPTGRRLVNQGVDGSETTVEEILSRCLEIPKANHNRSHQTRVGQILSTLGWRRARMTDGGQRRYVYRLDPSTTSATAPHAPTLI